MSFLKSNIFVFFCFVVLSFLLFGNGIGGDFVFDDRAIIVGNPMIERISGGFEAFLSPYQYARPQAGLYRPLTFASFVVDWHLFSGSPAGFHIVNIFLYALADFLIFLAVLNLSNRRTAVISSLLFLFLPIHVEAVTSIVGRGELLMFLFFAFAFYLVQKGYYKLAAISFLLSLLSKETGIAFLPVFLFFEFVWRKRSVGDLFKKSLYFVSPLIVYALLRYNALGSDYFLNASTYSFFNPIAAMDFWPGIWTAFKVIYLYIQKTVFPTYFSSDYSYNQITAVNNLFNSWQAMAGIVVFIVMIYLIVAKRGNLVGLGAAVFLFSYLVISNLFLKTGTIMAERLMYLPSFGFILVVSGLFSSFLGEHKKYARIFWIIFILILSIYGAQTIRGNALWKNEKTLFRNAYEHAPDSVVNISNMAGLLFREGRNNEALEKINEALKIEPKNSPTLHLGGQIYKQIGDDKKAEEFWLKGIEAQPDYLYPYLSLGAMYYKRGEFEAGEKIMIEAGEMYNTPNVLIILALNKIGLEKYAEAVELIEDKFSERPTEYELRFVLGIAYLKSGDELRAKELLLELKDPALTEDAFLQKLKNTSRLDIEI